MITTHIARAVWTTLLIFIMASAGCSDSEGRASRADNDAANASDTTSTVDVIAADASEVSDEPDLSSADTVFTDAREVTDASTCQEDALGLLTSSTAHRVETTAAISDLNHCPDADDWFLIELDGAVEVRVTGVEPLALTLFDSDGPRAEATRVGERLILTHATAQPETLRLRVHAEGSVKAIPYSLTLGEGVVACLDTLDEPNDTQAQAYGALSTTFEGAICADDEDWFVFDVLAGEQLTTRLLFDHDVGDLDMTLYQGAAVLGASETATDEEWLSFGPVATDAQVHLRVQGYQGAEGPYTLFHSLLGPSSSAASVTGQVTYDDPLNGTGERLTTPVRRIARYSHVEIVRDHDGAVVGETFTDAQGTYDVTAALHPGFDYYARAVAEIDVEGLTADVRDRTGAAGVRYAIAGLSGPLVAGSATSTDLHADLSSGAAGPMHIVDVTVDAMRLIRAHTLAPAPDLSYIWRAGTSASCGSCFTGEVIHLLGTTEDPDEFDDDIIRHEYGHYFVEHFSYDDSPGGSHRDRRVEPRLAYGEGVAYFFAAMADNDPLIVDTAIDANRLIDLEAVTQNGVALGDMSGTTNGAQSGDLREEVVAGILWDALDPATPAEPFDAVELGEDGHMAILLSYFGPTGPPIDLGVSGADLVDWLNAAACMYTPDSTGLESLANDRAFPWSAVEAWCSFKDGDARPWSIVQQGQELLLTAPPKHPAPGAMRLRRREGDGAWSERALVCDALPCVVGEAHFDSSIVVTMRAKPNQGASWHGDGALERLRGASIVRATPRGPVYERPATLK